MPGMLYLVPTPIGNLGYRLFMRMTYCLIKDVL